MNEFMDECMNLLIYDYESILEKEMATHSSILAWRIPWTKEPGRLQSMGSQRVRYNWATNTQHTWEYINMLSEYTKV